MDSTEWLSHYQKARAAIERVNQILDEVQQNASRRQSNEWALVSFPSEARRSCIEGPSKERRDLQK